MNKGEALINIGPDADGTSGCMFCRDGGAPISLNLPISLNSGLLKTRGSNGGILREQGLSCVLCTGDFTYFTNFTVFTDDEG